MILDGVKGGPKEKRLAAQFIPKFFSSFPELADVAINAQLDLCEDEDVSVSVSKVGVTNSGLPVSLLTNFSIFFYIRKKRVLYLTVVPTLTDIYNLPFSDKATGNQRATTVCDRGEHPQGRRHTDPTPPDRYWAWL